jgi:glycosyltransferase involved in cell wall biosynthesis
MSQLDWSPPRKNWMVFYNVPTEPLPPVRRDGRSGGRLTLLYAGTFAIDRVRLLVNVARAIEGLPTTLVLAGFGEYAETVQRIFRGKADIMGKLSQREVLRLTATSDVVLLPLDSTLLNYRIALANKFFEAMSCGAFILAPKGTLMGDIVEKERIGLAIDYSSVNEIKNAIAWIADNEDEVAQIRERGIALFHSRFNPRDVQRKYLGIVETLFSDP